MKTFAVLVALALIVRWLWGRQNITGGMNEESGILALVLGGIGVLIFIFWIL